jgi:putative hydrolase
MVTFAKTNKIKTLAITEHGHVMPDACHEYYYHNLCSLAREMFGVNLIFGCEANILDYTGRIDLSDVAVQQCDIIIASLHSRCIEPGSESQNTEAIIGAMKNKNISIIGQPNGGRYKLNYEEVIKNAAKYLINKTKFPKELILNCHSDLLKNIRRN